MRVLVQKNAATNYHHRCYRKAHPQCGMLHNPKWEAMLAKIQGRWIEIETKHLFSDQFNTVPIDGVSESGMRLMVEDIEEIEGDVRPGVYKCQWCYNCQRETDVCRKCGKSEYLNPLKVVVPFKNMDR